MSVTKIRSAETARSDNHFIDNYLLFQLAIVSHNFSTEFYEYLRTHGMSASKWRILLNLEGRPGMYVTQLAKNTLLEQSHVTKLTDQLCEEKLTKKRISDLDRRRVLVQITKRGEAVVAPLIKAAKKHERELLNKLDPGDAKKLKSILAKLVEPHLRSVRGPEN